MPIPLLHAVFTRRLACTRCGSEDVHPISGAFGPLVALVGLMRYGCRACRRPFWIRTGAAHPLSGRRRDTRDVPRPKHEKVDLSGLDADFERIRRQADDDRKPRLGKKDRRP